jgi:O-antigen/teichoic acid export membrane protein
MRRVREQLQDLLNSSLARNAGWMAIGQGAGFLMQAAYFVLLARLLGSAEYGIYAGTFALVSIASQYSALGSGTIFLRYVSANPEKFAAYWGNILLVLVVVSAVLCGLLHLMAPYVLNPASAAIVLPAAIGVCFSNQAAFSAGQVFQAFEKLRVTALMTMLTNLLRMLTAAALVLTLHHTTAWLWTIVSMIVSLVGAAIAVTIVTVRFGRPEFVPRLFPQHAVEGIGYAFASSTASAYNDLDKTMLSHYGMNLANGIYTMAYRVVDVATIPVFSIRDAAMPRFFAQGAKGIQKSAALANSLLKRATLLGIASAVFLFAVAPVIPHIVGQDFAASVQALRWLCLIPLFRSVHQMTGSALTGAGLQRYRTSTQVVAACFNLALNIWLIPSHGWLGAAWASLVTDASLGALNWTVLFLCKRSVCLPIKIPTSARLGERELSRD